MASPFQSIGVFCGAHSGSNPNFELAARETGSVLAERGITTVYGGGSVGLMGAVADGALSKDGHVIGVITTFLESRELGHTKIAELEVVETMLERKQRMADLSDAFIVLPGGIGTLDELFEMLVWSRLFVHDKPIGLLNVDGFYDELIAFTHTTQVEADFIKSEEAANLLYSDDLGDLLSQLESAASKTPSSPYRK
ncbi:MAG: TIGR00730 family Rossman fold protein [Verrucomicrobiota bacterium]